MEVALYGPNGFFAGAGAGPAGHFRTSVHASPLFASAVLRLLEDVDAALGRPGVFDVVDVGAGRGELLAALHALLPGSALAGRARLVGVEVATRPAELDGDVGWLREVPQPITGMLIATEWLDNVPLDLAEVDERGRLRRVRVDRSTGTETLGEEIDAADAFWLARWWPMGSPPKPPAEPWARAEIGWPPGAQPGARAEFGWPPDARPGVRAEIGWPRDLAWADAVAAVRRGGALAVDYGHLRAGRPALGTLTGFRGGRQVKPVPDGTCDVTAHVAMDAVAGAVGTPYTLITQREALKALGVDGARPPLDLARTDPAGYLRALAAAGAGAELIDPAGLGGHWWLLHTVGIDGVGSFGRD